MSIAHLFSTAVANTTADTAVSGAITTTGASLLVVSTGYYPNVATVTLTDSNANTWVDLGSTIDGGVLRARLFYCAGPTVGAGHTFTVTGTGDSPSFTVAGFSGTHATPYNGDARAIGGSSLTVSPGSITPSQVEDLFVTGLHLSAAASSQPTINSGFTVRAWSGGQAFATLIQAGAAVAVNPTWTRNGSATAEIALMAAFKSATVTPTVTVKPGNLTMTVGGVGTYKAAAYDNVGVLVGAATFTWTTSNAAVATVAATGEVTAVGIGTATITATSNTSVVGTATATVISATPTTLFADSFASGDLTKVQNGVSWGSSTYTVVSTSKVRTGSYALRFNEGTGTTISEQRFGGMPNLTEVFLEYYLYYPDGTESLGPAHGTYNNSGGLPANRGVLNDKFLRLWGDSEAQYAISPGVEVGASTRGDAALAVGDAKIFEEYCWSDPVNPQYGMGEGDPSPPANPTLVNNTSFDNAANRGRWMRIRVQAKRATLANTDGILRIWVDSTLVVNNVQLATAARYTAQPTSYTNGYFLGASNNWFQAGQLAFLADLTISTGGFLTTDTVTASVTVTPSSATVAIAATATLTSTSKNAAGDALTGKTPVWSSLSPSIASVNSSTGVVTGVAAGTATIRSTEGGFSGTSTITVPSPAVASLSVVVNSNGFSALPLKFSANTTISMTATAKDASGTILPGRTYTWTASNPLVASITVTGDGTATIKGLKTGSCTITVTCEGVS